MSLTARGESAGRAASGEEKGQGAAALARLVVRAVVLLAVCALFLPPVVGTAAAVNTAARNTAAGNTAVAGGRAAQETGDASADRGPDPIDFAILVDQSASLSDDDLAREVEAAALIGQAEISETSRATVIGFGSAEQPGQSPVDEVCGLTVLNTAGRQQLSSCVRDLIGPARAAIRPGTDFPAAIRQARVLLTEDGRDVPRGIFLPTDGKLDGRDSPEYGGDQAERQANGEKQLVEELDIARDEGIQVWPLGFGSDIDRAALAAMATAGYDSGCAELPDATPRMRVVDGSAGLHQALQETFAAARCAHLEPIPPSFRPPGTTTVTIPKIATDGSITVTKHDPAVTVTYLDPRGREVPLQGTFDGSSFEVSGRDGPVEALRIRDPRPGTWQVRLDAPEGSRAVEATVSVIWQGRIRSSIVLNPAAPRPGEETTVEVRLKTRDGVVIDDPGDLAGMRVAVRLSGSGFTPVDQVLSDGEGKPPVAGDGRVAFTGTFTVPATADGELVVTSEAAAPGVSADQRPYRSIVTQGAPPVSALLTLGGEVHPGGSLSGTLVVGNDDDRPHTLRLVLEDRAQGDGTLRVDPSSVTVKPGEHTNIPVTFGFGTDVPLGTPGGLVTVVDTDDADRLLYSDFLRIAVTPVPGWWDRWGTHAVLGTALALLIGLALVLRVWAERQRANPSGLVLELVQDGRQLSRLEVRRTTGRIFHFTVDRTRHGTTLRTAKPGAPSAYQLRRERSGAITLRTPKGVKRTGSPGTALPLGGELELVVRLGGSRSTPGRGGRRPAAGQRSGRAWLRRTGDPGAAGGPRGAGGTGGPHGAGGPRRAGGADGAGRVAGTDGPGRAGGPDAHHPDF